MKLKVGQALVSAVDSTKVIVTRIKADDVNLSCGGVPMVPEGVGVTNDARPDPEQQSGALLGKRYADESGTIELLCTRAGPGTLALDGRPLAMQRPKSLPSSD